MYGESVFSNILLGEHVTRNITLFNVQESGLQEALTEKATKLQDKIDKKMGHICYPHLAIHFYVSIHLHTKYPFIIQNS